MKILPAKLLEQPKFGHFIWETFLRYRKWAVTILILRCVSMSTNITWPFFSKLITDQLVLFSQTHHFNWRILLWTMALGFFSWFGGSAADSMAKVFSGRRVASIRAGIRLLVLDDIYRQSQQFFHDRFSGSISTSMRDLSESVSDILNETVVQFIPGILLFFVLSLVLFNVHIGYAILMVFWIVLQILLVYATKRKSQQKSRSYADQRSELFGKIIDSVTNYISITSFTAYSHERDHILAAEHEVIEKRVAVVSYVEKIKLVTAFLEVAFMFFGFLALYLYLFKQGRATVGDFMFVISAVYNLMISVKEISNKMFWLYEQIGIGQEAVRKILTPRLVDDAKNAKEIHVTNAVIEIKNLDFAYVIDRPVLKDVSFTIQKSEKIGLVGYSGAGKTTFVNLIMRFYDVDGGRILIDGQDITSVTQESLRRNIALIPQETSLFHRSLKDNIRIARPEADDADIIEAAKMAGAHDFIMTLPKAYDTLVGERGVKLSGGQRQRVAIARAFLKAAPILILDEATSALDSVTEQEIQDALEKVMQDRTTLVIAHRLSTLRRMDRVLVFDKGRIVEQGSHDQLLAMDGLYARMWAMQAGGFLPEKDPAPQE